MGKVTVRWRDIDNDTWQEMAEERTIEGEKVGYDLGDPGQVFLRAWADDETLIVYDNRVIFVLVEK